jgi:predicted transcriptional regulator
MKVSDIMTSNVFTLLSDDTIGKALNIMSNKRINQIPIIDRYRVESVASGKHLLV